MDLLARVRRTIRQHDLARGGTRVVVALSGGPDSVALTYLFDELDRAGELTLAGLAHFNHQLRSAADQEERLCERVAQAIGRPLLAGREDVAARAASEKRSIEDAARVARYAFLESAQVHFTADVVALGHTRDDQAETFLLRLLRGAGAKGLAAMHPQRGAFVRPLLACRRRALVEYLESRQIPYATDESNSDLDIPRNRVRAELLPLLERRFNPSIVEVLADEAEVARQEWLWMSATTRELAGRICRQSGDSWHIDADRLAQLPTALARLVVHGMMTEASRGQTVPFAHVDAALQLSRGEGEPFDAVGHHVERIGGDVVLTSRPQGAAGQRTKRHGAASNFFHYSLSIPGEVELVEAGYVVSAEPAASATAVLAARSPEAVAVRRDLCAGPLAVRNRRPGDRFRPLGLAGKKKLQDYFVDRKIAQRDRDHVPLVVDESDQILWVAGHTIDEAFRVTDPAQAVLILRLRRV